MDPKNHLSIGKRHRGGHGLFTLIIITYIVQTRFFFLGGATRQQPIGTWYFGQLRGGRTVRTIGRRSIGSSSRKFRRVRKYPIGSCGSSRLPSGHTREGAVEQGVGADPSSAV